MTISATVQGGGRFCTEQYIIHSGRPQEVLFKMVHKDTAAKARPRGRPRAYDADQALQGATRAFWRQGYSGTSLDQLSDATDMNRPSMYAAFGDKRALYLKTLQRYVEQANAATAEALDPALPLQESLRRFYALALSMYLPAGDKPRGCYLIGTATTEAVGDSVVRDSLREALRGFERALEERFRHARKSGELPASADPALLASMASAVLHSLAVRSRAGERREWLEEFVAGAVRLLCGSAGASGVSGRAKSRRPKSRINASR
jgi:AcrR family transcriptional regulator